MNANHSPLQVVLLADDLTGAADSAAAFTQCARAVYIHTGICPLPATLEAGGVFSCNGRMRSLAPSQAFQSAAQYLARLAEARTDLLGIKCDSVLRGHLPHYLQAARTILPHRTILICPAFPARGRTVQQNMLFVHGQNTQSTVTGAFHLPDTAHCTIEKLADAAPGQAVCCDAASEEELAHIARFILGRPGSVLPIGSAGLFRAIAQQIAGKPSVQAGFSLLPAHHKALVLAGSRHPAAAAQAHYLACMPGVALINSHNSTASQIQRLWQNDMRALLWQTEMQEQPEGMKLPPVADILPQQNTRIVATGGDTAEMVCRALQIPLLLAEAEPEPGMALTMLPENSRLQLVMKSGGFGDRTALARCAGLEEKT